MYVHLWSLFLIVHTVREKLSQLLQKTALKCSAAMRSQFILDEGAGRPSQSCCHRRPSSFSPPPGGQKTEAVNGSFASPFLSILLKALVLTTYAVRPSRSGHRRSSSSSPPPPGGQKLFSI